MPTVSSSPPRAPPIKYPAPLGTRWEKETAAAGGVGAFDLPTDPKTIGPWILGECVGKGASGRVKIAKHRLTGHLAAVKILPVAPIVSSRTSLATQQAKSEKQRLGIDREITMMKLMNHPNIMRIYDVYEGEKELFLVLEYVEGGELFDFLVNRGRLPPTEALAFFKQIIYGLNYAHSFSIIHRDLKPENILIASISPPLIKIADWGMAAFAHPSLSLETSCGSPHYASPEIVNGQAYKGNATDVWSCGVILYALLTGRLPFDDKNVRVLLGKVKNGKYDMPNWVDPLAKDLLSKMLVVDVEQRIKMPEIISHPWFNSSALPTSSEQQAAELAMAQFPPSPSTLARPIASPSLIDPELFESLRVIWGRHADPDGNCIKRDLCSPAGRGVHAKAFYFLLSQYRERSSRNDLEEGEDSHTRAKFNLGWELSNANKVHSGKRNSMYSVEASASQTSVTVPMLVTSTGPLLRRYSGGIRRSFSRERAPSPAGPRAPHKRASAELWRNHPLFSQDDYVMQSPIGSPDPAKSVGFGRGGPRSAWPRRGFTGPPVQGRERLSTIQSPKQLRAQDILNQYHLKPAVFAPSLDVPMGRPKSPMATPSTLPLSDLKVYAPVPVLASKPISIMKELNEGLAHIPLDGVKALSEMQNPAAASGANSVSVQEPPSMNTTTIPGPAAMPLESDDKENRAIGDSWKYVEPEEYKVRGLGLGVGREIGNVMENVTHAPEATLAVKSRKKKEKKSRPPALDFRGLNQNKRMTILGSPITTSPHLSHVPAGRLITSPVIEEFKGWFSNLFNRNLKNHGNGLDGIIYSSDCVHQMCVGVRRLLESMGVVVESHQLEGPTSPALVDRLVIFKCHIDDPNSARSTLKSVRFRIEIFAAPMQGGISPLSPPPYNMEELGTSVANHAAIGGGQNTVAVDNGTAPQKTRSNQWSLNLKSPSPDGRFPVGCTCAIYMAYEKGSMSSFRSIWRRLKDEHESGAPGSPPCYQSYSPAMVSTPMSEYAEAVPV